MIGTIALIFALVGFTALAAVILGAVTAVLVVLYFTK